LTFGMQDQYANYLLDGSKLHTLDLFSGVCKPSNMPLDLCF